MNEEEITKDFRELFKVTEKIMDLVSKSVSDHEKKCELMLNLGICMGMQIKILQKMTKEL